MSPGPPASAATAPAPRWCGRRSRPCLDQPAALDVLDIGGGTGGFAVRVAELGHRVTVVDPSPDALAALGRRAREVGVEVAGQQGDLVRPARAGRRRRRRRGALPRRARGGRRPGRRARHDPRGAPPRRHASRCWSPSGTPPSSPARWPVTSRRRSRSWPTHPTRPPGRTGRRFTADEVTALLADAGFEVGSVHGVRVFADLVPGSLLDLEPGATAALRRARAGRRRASRVPPAGHAAAPARAR